MTEGLGLQLKLIAFDYQSRLRFNLSEQSSTSYPEPITMHGKDAALAAEEGRRWPEESRLDLRN